MSLPVPTKRTEKPSYIKAAAPIAICLFLAACGSGPSAAPPESAVDLNSLTEAELYEGAKKEGTLVLYAADAEPLIAGFEAAYPGVKVEWSQAQGEQSAAKMAAEARAGTYTVDVIDTEQNTAYAMGQSGLLAEYHPPAGANFDDKFKTPYFIGYRIQLKPMAYNTSLIPPAEAPKALTDLLDPKWAGQICAEESEVSVFANMVGDLGEQETVAFWETLTANGLRFISGQTALVQSIIGGECPLAVSANLHTVSANAAKGAPVGWVKSDPIYGNYGAAGVAAHAPHPHAARLWANFLLSAEGQATVVDSYRVPTNPEVEPQQPELANHNYNAIVAGAEVMTNFSEYNKLFYAATGRPVVG